MLSTFNLIVYLVEAKTIILYLIRCINEWAFEYKGDYLFLHIFTNISIFHRKALKNILLTLILHLHKHLFEIF